MAPNRPTTAQLGLILHRMLVDIRNLSYEPGEEKRVNELADFAEIIPLQFINRHDGYLDGIVAGLRDWAARDERAARYTAVLDMTPEQIAAYVLPAASVAAAG